MPLRHLGFVELPAHAKAGGFDHAAVDEATGRVYVAHTANDAVDVIDIVAGTCVGSVPGLTAVAGALAVTARDPVPAASAAGTTVERIVAPLAAGTVELIATSNRGENTVGLFRPDDPTSVDRIAVGIRPNGLACDPRRRRLLVAHVGDSAIPRSQTVSIVDIDAGKTIANIPVSGRTRWTVYDPGADVFYVNIADPPEIVVVEAAEPVRVRRTFAIAHAGPHGLDIDIARRRLFCACDAGVLVEVDADSGLTVATAAIAGAPDVVFFNARRSRLYVAIGDPGVIEVFDTNPFRRHETVPTEAGAHTLSFDAARNIVCAFLPESHRAAVYEDTA